MPKNQNITNNPPRCVAGVASVAPSSSAPSAGIVIGGNAGVTVACDACGLHLPANASHQDVQSHVCYRGFTKTITAGQIVLS